MIEGSRDFQEIRTPLDGWRSQGVTAECLVDEPTDPVLDLRGRNRDDDEDAVVVAEVPDPVTGR